MNKAELFSYLTAETPTIKAAAERMVGAVFSAIADPLALEEPVATAGFEKFTARRYTAMNREPSVESALHATTGAAPGSGHRAAGFTPKHRRQPSAGARALWCVAVLLALCAPATAQETLFIGFGLTRVADEPALATADDASPAEGRLLAELPLYTDPTLAAGEQFFLELALDAADGDISPFTLSVREPSGARRPLVRNDVLVLTGGETMPVLELRTHGNAAAGIPGRITVRIANVKIRKHMRLRYASVHLGERTVATTPASAASIYPISEDKQALVARMSKIICEKAIRGDFYHMKMMLKNAGRRYLGEAITIEEAYPYIRCRGSSRGGTDLLGIIVENPANDLFWVSLILYFEEEANHVNVLRKLVSCKKDFGSRCLDIFGHIENRRRIYSDNPIFAEKYDYLETFLRRRINPLGGPLRDPQFCREVLGEQAYCQ